MSEYRYGNVMYRGQLRSSMNGVVVPGTVPSFIRYNGGTDVDADVDNLVLRDKLRNAGARR